MKLLRPPHIDKSFLTAERMIDILKEYTVYDKRYLHFDEIARRLHDKDLRLEVWAALKMKRASTGQIIELAGQPAMFNLTPQITKAMSLVDKFAFGHNGEPLPEDATTYLVSQLIMEEAISSSQLEGAATTSRVARELLAVARPPRNEDESMIMGNWRLMSHIASMGDTPLTTADILDIHLLACQNINDDKYQPGLLRDNNDVYVGGRDGEIVHTPPEFHLIAGMLDNLCELVIRLDEDEHHPLVVACIMHFAIGYIHPFNDGNGRTARGLFYYHMIKKGYTAFRYISISKLLKAAPVKYGISYLYTEIDDMDLTYFIAYQCDIVLRAVRDFATQIETLHNERRRLVMFVENNLLLAKGELDIMAIALNAPGSLLSAGNIKDRLGISDNTARARLNSLKDKGLLRPVKDGKGFVYQAPSSVNKLKEWAEKAGQKMLRESDKT
ncbi:hypothetical protein BIY29_11355 [Brenneria alni]|uniref:Fido domain-containing protein n=1 Tax=Brenneria alni TaxID=71656 RepID=A0A421DN24_9GAMM|nr:Fic family protein [Brenneria alni]RLM22822.1 hypothetical protein BIY29_11355 [Brenneria alni]